MLLNGWGFYMNGVLRNFNNVKRKWNLKYWNLIYWFWELYVDFFLCFIKWINLENYKIILYELNFFFYYFLLVL